VLALPGIQLLQRNDSGPRAGCVERWELRGLPALHEALFEAGLLGDSIEAALLTRLNARLDGTHAIREWVEVLIDVRACAIPQLLDQAAESVRQLDLDALPFSDLVDGARRLRMSSPAPDAQAQDSSSPEA